MPGVFISYRREDSSGYAGRLFDILCARIGRENIYMDLDMIRGGDNFVTVIEEKLALCDVLLALIGERWLTCTGANGSRRLDMADDFVRLEITKALERGVRVIPVLVSNATMPHQKDLPDDLRPFSLRQAMDLRDAHFRADADRLIEVLHEKPSITNRLQRLKTNRFAQAALSVLLVAAVAGGILLIHQAKQASRANPDSAIQPHTAPGKEAVPPAQAAIPVEIHEEKRAAKAPADITGKWEATVKYDWPGAIYTETFNFELDGTGLSGTASFLSVDRGIFDGKIDGEHVSFETKSATEMDDKTYQDKHYYKGTLNGDIIQFSMLTDSDLDSHVPVHFTAKKLRAK
jgi:hypothetical protein